MENAFFIRGEIIIFFLSLWYFMYYLLEKTFQIYFNVKKIVNPKRKISDDKIKKIKKISENIVKKNNEKLKNKKSLKNAKKISKLDLEKISTIIKKVRLNIEKKYFDKAKNLIIEWLAIDKFNKDLNLSLASIYENEKDFKKAEYIYIDLLKVNESKFEILKKLGFNIALQNKFVESMEIYLTAYEKKKDDIDVIEIIADLAYEIKDYKIAYKFIKLYLKQFPRNVEKLKMKWYCQEILWKTENALDTYKKVLELQPYNSQVAEKINHLEVK